MDQIKHAFAEVITYINKNTDKLKKTNPSLFTDEVQHVIKELIDKWNSPDKKANFLWDIRDHHTYINKGLIFCIHTKKMEHIDQLWQKYIQLGQELRIDMIMDILN